MAQIRSVLQTEYHMSNDQMEKIRYVSLTFASEISKLILLAGFFCVISKLPELIISVVALFSIRCYTGGIHLKHYLSCLCFSFLFFFIGICVLPNLILINSFAMILILNICIILIYLIGPILSVYRKALSKEQKKKNSLTAVSMILIYICLIYVLQDSHYLDVGFWMIVLQTLQLGFAKIILQMKGAKQK